jgi:hypothetical protein
MDKNFINQASHRISGKPVSSGRVSNPSAHPEQNGGFSDGFPTNSPVVALHSGQPGKSSDLKNPMKSIDYPPSEGSPAHPPCGRAIAGRPGFKPPIRNRKWSDFQRISNFLTVNGASTCDTQENH